MAENSLIKVCVDSGCDTTWHNCGKMDRKCRNCGNTIKTINWQTYIKKFSLDWHQYDYQSEEVFRPLQKNAQLELEL